MSDYPCLMWSRKTGEEITVHSPEEQRAMTAEGYRLTQETFTLKEPVEPDEPEPEIPIPSRRGRH